MVLKVFEPLKFDCVMCSGISEVAGSHYFCNIQVVDAAICLQGGPLMCDSNGNVCTCNSKQNRVQHEKRNVGCIHVL